MFYACFVCFLVIYRSKAELHTRKQKSLLILYHLLGKNRLIWKDSTILTSLTACDFVSSSRVIWHTSNPLRPFLIRSS